MNQDEAATDQQRRHDEEDNTRRTITSRRGRWPEGVVFGCVVRTSAPIGSIHDSVLRLAITIGFYRAIVVAFKGFTCPSG
jgi:hypothetical protein